MIGLATTSIAWIIFAIIAGGWIVYYFLNNASSRKEVGSEIELAPNRGPTTRTRCSRGSASSASSCTACCCWW